MKPYFEVVYSKPWLPMGEVKAWRRKVHHSKTESAATRFARRMVATGMRRVKMIAFVPKEVRF